MGERSLARTAAWRALDSWLLVQGGRRLSLDAWFLGCFDGAPNQVSAGASAKHRVGTCKSFSLGESLLHSWSLGRTQWRLRLASRLLGADKTRLGVGTRSLCCNRARQHLRAW